MRRVLSKKRSFLPKKSNNEIFLWELLEKNEPYPKDTAKIKVVEADYAACRAKEQGRTG